MSEARKVSPTSPTVIPDKLYFRIGEVARLLGVETHTLRFWESEFPQLRVGKGGTGQRLYRKRDVETLVEIKQLLYSEGYTIPGARQLLQTRARRKDGIENRTVPASAAQSSAASTQHGTQKNGAQNSAGLHRLRADLRDLSAQLARPVAGTSGKLRDNARPRPWSRTEGTQPSARRGGIHLTDRSSSAAPRLPGLFDQGEDG